jgi:hypothetical protein
MQTIFGWIMHHPFALTYDVWDDLHGWKHNHVYISWSLSKKMQNSHKPSLIILKILILFISIINMNMFLEFMSMHDIDESNV